MIGVEQAAPHVGGIDLAGVLDQSEGIGIVAAALLDALLEETPEPPRAWGRLLKQALLRADARP